MKMSLGYHTSKVSFIKFGYFFSEDKAKEVKIKISLFQMEKLFFDY